MRGKTPKPRPSIGPAVPRTWGSKTSEAGLKNLVEGRLPKVPAEAEVGLHNLIDGKS